MIMQFALTTKLEKARLEQPPRNLILIGIVAVHLLSLVFILIPSSDWLISEWLSYGPTKLF